MKESTKTIRVLFFGRKNCNYSNRILRELIACNFQVKLVEAGTRSGKLPKAVANWEGDYIICFRSLYILPKALLDRASIAAINFHPAPPEYPGSGCINFALYDETAVYGVTAHLMNEFVDNGAILDVRRFEIMQSDSVSTLLARTHQELYRLCSDFIAGIKERNKDFLTERMRMAENEKWNGRARSIRELDVLQKIDVNTTAEELGRIIRATHTKEYPVKLEFHGFTFLLGSA